MLVTAVSYAVITINGLVVEQHDHGEDHVEEQILFGIAVVSYLIIAYGITKTTSLIPKIIAIFGNIGLVVLYVIATSALSESLLEIHTEELSDFGITIKILQVAMIVLLAIQIKKRN